MSTIISRKWIFLLVIALLVIISGGSIQQAASQELANEYSVYMPLIIVPEKLRVTDAWVGNAQGISLGTFLPAAPMRYIIVGENINIAATELNLAWTQTGPCGTNQIVTETFQADPGIWVRAYPAIAPDCLGAYTTTVQITAERFTNTRIVNFDVATTSIIISDKQGFDRCNMPSIEDMQTWWDASPYYVANVYLGGISFDNTTGCSNDNIDDNWIQSVADQGWSYLLAWVGPQSPCSGYSYKMSYDSDITYLEGRNEADAAIQAASEIGLPSNIIIYYDVEGYGNEYNYACREAVASFMDGWTERLHELGAKSGAYGSPCNSHVSDWAALNSPPDDVWVAHWLGYSYNPDATVWDLACLSNDLWPNHQRVRQYAGDHTETWGGVPLRIDSNILDGEVVALATSSITTTTMQSSSQVFAGSQIQDLALLSENQGWLIYNDRLLMTKDGGAHWDDFTPQGISRILDVHFLDISSGLLLYQDELGLGLLSTPDGGLSWIAVTLPPIDEKFTAASLNFSADGSGKLELSLSTGSSFNRVRQLRTPDGGQTWSDPETISLPIDEELQRNYALNANLPAGVIQVDWLDVYTGWALTQQGTCQGDKVPVWQVAPPDTQPWECALQNQLWTTSDGGQTWTEITP